MLGYASFVAREWRRLTKYLENLAMFVGKFIRRVVRTKRDPHAGTPKALR